MNILGIETSCDETAAAVVRDGREVLSSVVYTQIPLHQPYGGVVPEIASRAHIEKISEVVKTAIAKADVPIDAVAVTFSPGLTPALIVGLNAAKGLAKALKKPLIAINHIQAHLHTPFLFDSGETTCVPDPFEAVPALGLVISGGHTTWYDIQSYGKYEVLGQTLDDAAGEAFDKASKMLSLGYPGGPVIDRIAQEYAKTGEIDLIPFPKGRPRPAVSSLAGLNADYCVSFSGLKTSLLRYVDSEGGAQALAERGETGRIVYSYQEAIVQSVAERTRNALKRGAYRSLIVGGGVSLNSRLRAVLGEVAQKAKVSLLMAKPKYTGDNGAMIAALAYFKRDICGDDAMRIDVSPNGV